MSELIDDLNYYNNLFPNSEISVSEQANKIEWSERKCYIYKFFITKLTKPELELLTDFKGELDYELIGAICVHNPKIRLKILEQLDRVVKSDSPFDEIQMIIDENSTPDPLLSIKNDFWLSVKDYIEEREHDEYPFNKKGRGMLSSVAKMGYKTLNTNQLNYLHGLIENDRNRPEADHFFVNDYLILKGFEEDCNLIKKKWASH